VHNAGVTVVTIAGNRYTASACSYSPGRVPEAITVGAIDSTEMRWDNRSSSDANFTGSGYGPCVDLFAPGRGVTSSVPTSGNFSDLSGFRTGSGTSFAAPHVAGAVARCLEVNPTATPAQIQSFLINHASPKVLDPASLGTGSPDRLLYIPPGWPAC